MAEHLRGLVAAPFTPMTEDGGICFEAVEKYPAFLAANGCSGAFVNGTTGESLSLTVAERRQLAERWVAHAPDGITVIVQVGHNCLAESRDLAAHAQQIGAAAIGMMAPCFFRPESVDDLVACCSEVAQAAPELPFYFYHLPGKTGVHFPMVDFLRAAAGVIPTLTGIKYTFEDLADLGQCIDLQGGRFTLLFGRDEALLGALAIGAEGAVGTTYSLAAPLYRRIMDSFEAGDLAAAQADQGRSREMVAVFKRHGGLPAFKAGMGLIGLDCGPVRLPQRALSAEQTEALRADLEAIGFFDYCCKA
jgi:N-acetylneuraminate lyase